MHHNQYHKGLKAEQLAKTFLQKKGYVCLEERYRTPYGEIDLVMQDQSVIVAVEVKFRKKTEDCHYALTDKQKQRIHDALLYYAQTHNQWQADLRCDVVLLSFDCHPIHYENAW